MVDFHGLCLFTGGYPKIDFCIHSSDFFRMYFVPLVSHCHGITQVAVVVGAFLKRFQQHNFSEALLLMAEIRRSPVEVGS